MSVFDEIGFVDMPSGQDPQQPSPQGPRTEPDYMRIRQLGGTEEDVEAIRNDIWPRLRAQRQLREKQFLASFSIAAKENPDLEGEAQRVAQELGQSTELVRSNLDVAREVAKRRQLEVRDFAQRFPTLYRRLSADKDFQRIAHDDLDNLTTTETTWGVWARQAAAGSATNERGFIGMRMALGQDSQRDHERLIEIARLQEDADRDRRGFSPLRGSTNIGGQMAAPVLTASAAAGAAAALTGPAAVAAAPVAGTVAFFGFSTLTEAGNQYIDLIEQGIDPTTARTMAGVYGVVAGALETVGGKILAKPFTAAGGKLLTGGVRAMTKETAGKAFVEAAKSYLKGVGGETATEVGQEVAAIASEGVARGISRPDLPGPSWGEITDRLFDIAGQTLEGMILLGLPGPAVNYTADAVRAREAARDATFLTQLATGAEASKVRGRNPTAYQANLAAQAERYGGETVYIDGAVLRQALNNADLAEVAVQAEEAGVAPEQLEGQVAGRVTAEFARLFPEAAAHIDRAVQDGENVAIPTAEFVAKLGQTPLMEVLKPHAKLDPNAMSAEQAAQFQKEVKALGKEAIQTTEERMQADKEFAQQIRRIEQQIEKQAVAAGRPPAQARSAGSLVGAFVAVQSNRLGITPDEFERQFPVSIVSGTTEQAQTVPLQQDQASPPSPGDAGDAGDAVPTGQSADNVRPKKSQEPVAAEDADTGQGQDVLSVSSTPPRGGFDPETLTVILTEKSDPSTLIHELSHAFLHIYATMASAPNAPPQLAQDFQTFLEWRGVKDVAAWNALSQEQQRKHHEAFAYNFEVYAFTGKAPSTALQSLFDRFRAWLVNLYRTLTRNPEAVYKQEFGEDLPTLTPELRAVMDRMLASTEAIEEAQAIRSMAPMFQTREEFTAAGNDEKGWDGYQRAAQEATDQAIAEHLAGSLRSIGWVSRAMKREERNLDRQAKERRAEIRTEVEAELTQQRVYRAQSILRKGITGPNGETIKVKLSTDAVRAVIAGPLEAANRRANRNKAIGAPDLLEGEEFTTAAVKRMTGMTNKDGVPLESVAEELGYETGEQMIRDLVDATPLREAVEALTEARMLGENPELMDPIMRREAIERAIHNEARARFVATELRLMTRIGQPVRLMLKAAREAARQALGIKPVGQISPRDHSIAEGQEARAAEKAQKKGDAATAVAHKRRQMLQHAMVKEAMAIRAEVLKALESFKRFNASDRNLAKTRNVDLVNAARSILAAYGIGRQVDDPRDHLAPIQAYNPDFYNQILPVVEAASANPKPYDDLTVDQFRAMRDAVDALWHQSKRSHEIEVEGRKVAREAAVGEMRERMVAIGIPETVPGEEQAVTDKERRGGYLSGIRAQLTRVEHWARKMDGGQVGPFTRYLWRPLRTAIDRYRTDRNRYYKRFHDLVLAHQWHDGTKIAAPELGYTFEDKAELVGALMQTGNQSNLRNMLVAGRGQGREWGAWVADPLTGEGQLDDSRWRAFLTRMIAEGKITKSDFDFVQAIWDLNEELKPRAQEAHHDVTGYYFDEVEATPIETPWGTYRGGYVPSRVDHDLAPALRQRVGIEGMEDTERDFRQGMPMTGKNFTITRAAGAVYPRVLNVRAQLRHFDEVLRYINMQPRVRDVLSILKDPDFAAPMNRLDRTAIDELLMPWLDSSARQLMVKPGQSPLMDRIFSALRRTTGMAIMFGNVVNTLQQLTGVSNATLFVKPRYLKAASWRYLANHKQMAETAAGKSPFMDDRLKSAVGQMLDEIDASLKPGWWAGFQRWSQRHTYFMQHWMQNHVDIMVWHGAYDQALARQATEADAVAEADAAVRLSQGSATPEDSARFEKGTPFARLWTMFTSYFNAIFNQISNAQPGAERAKATVMGLMVPALMGAAIQQLMWGGWDDEDDDGYSDEVALWFFGSQLKAAASMAPGIGPAMASLVSSQGDRMSLSPVMSSAQSLVRGFVRVGEVAFDNESGRKTLTGRDLRDLLTATAVASGIPVAVFGRPVGYARDVALDRIEPAGALDAVRGALTGR